MKLLFSSPSPPEVGLLKTLLDEAGIPCEIRNDTIYQNLPGAAFQPELWVLNEKDYPAACEICDAWRESVVVEAEPADSNNKRRPDYSGSVGGALGALLFFGWALLMQKQFAQSRKPEYALGMVCLFLIAAAFLWLAIIVYPKNKAK
jgi:hypothetical protein